MDMLLAVNRILPKLGEHPVTTLTGRHSTVALIVAEVATQVDSICQAGWWFNEFNTTVALSPEGELVLPTDTLAFLPDDMQYNAVQRGGKLFNADTLTYLWTVPLAGKIKLRIPFEELPESAAQYAWYSALCAVYVTDIGLAQDYQVWTQAAAAAGNQMQAEHLDQKKYSTARTWRYQRIRAAMRG